MTVAFSMLLGSNACRERARDVRSEGVTSVSLYGYQAIRVEPSRVVYLFDREHPPRIAWSGSSKPQVGLRSRRGSTESLTIQKTEDRADRRMSWLSALPLELGATGELEVDGHRFSVEAIRPAESWPTVVRAKTSTRAESILRALSQSSTTALERLAAKKELARTLARKGDADGYRTVQTERAADAESAGLYSEAADALSAAAFYAYRARNYEAVEPLVLRSIALARRNDHAIGEARAELMRGYAQYDLGRYRSAIGALERASELAWRTGDDADLAWIQKGLVYRQQELGIRDGAVETIDRLAAYYDTAPDRAQLSYLGERGWIRSRAMAFGDIPPNWDEPRADLNQALVLARKLDAPEDEQTVLANLAWLHYAERDLDRARQYVDQLRAAKGFNPQFAQTFADLMSARIALAAGRADDAIVAAERAVDSARRLSGARPTEETWRAHFVLAEALSHAHPRRAHAEFERAIGDMESLARATAIRNVRVSFFDDRAALYEGAVVAAIRAGDISGAFEIADRSRTQLLWGFAWSAQFERLPIEASVELSSLRTAFVEAREGLDKLRRESPLVPLTARERHTRTVREAEKAVARAFDALQNWQDENVVGNPLAVSTQQIQSAIREDAVLLATFVGSSTTVGFRVTRSKIEVVSEPTSAKEWRTILGDESALVLAGRPDRELEFLAAADATLDRATLTILPFAAALSHRAKPRAGAPLVVADPASNLDAARREGRAIAARQAGTTLLEGDAARRAPVWTALRTANRFHFAGHAVLHPTDPWDAKLELAGGDVITLEDLLADPPGVVHAVLNGCKTGGAQRAGRRFVLGLPDALMVGGANTILATFHDVDDTEAAKFVTAFYEAGGERDPVGAYRTAALADREAGGERWRSFYVMGAGQ